MTRIFPLRRFVDDREWHVIRCRTLARELQLQGAEVLFLCRRQKGDLIYLLKRNFQC